MSSSFFASEITIGGLILRLSNDWSAAWSWPSPPSMRIMSG